MPPDPIVVETGLGLCRNKDKADGRARIGHANINLVAGLILA